MAMCVSVLLVITSTFCFGKCTIEPMQTGVVTIPANWTSIAAQAFDGCTDLKSITFGNRTDSFISIGKWALRGTGLKRIVLPHTMTFIHNEAFDECDNLTSITFEHGTVPPYLYFGALKGAKIDECRHIVPTAASSSNTSNCTLSSPSTMASSILFLGDSTMHKTTESYLALHNLRGNCTSVESRAFGPYLLKGWKPRTEWVAPRWKMEGPVDNGLRAHGETDCGGCSYMHCHLEGSERLVFIPVEFARDVELQTNEFSTTQEVLSNYLLTHHFDNCIISTGIHDEAIDDFFVEQYNLNVHDYLELVAHGCNRITWIGIAHVGHDVQYLQNNKDGRKFNDIIAKNAFISKHLSNIVDVYEMSKGYSMADNVHFKEDYYTALAKALPVLFNSRQSAELKSRKEH